jgi:hypothetical protein
MSCVNNALHTNTITYEPLIGWDKSFSLREKNQYATIYNQLTNKRGFDAKIAEVLSYMILYKQKYNLKYSDEQEEQLNSIVKYIT